MIINDWFVYIVRCADDSLYTGITKDVDRRVQEHNEGDKLAAKYTRARLPVVLVYQESCESRSAATKREIEIKLLSRTDKDILLSQEKL